MARREDMELVSVYRDKASEHVNPVFIRGIRSVYDLGSSDGYELARREFELAITVLEFEVEHGRKPKFSELRDYPGMNGAKA